MPPTANGSTEIIKWLNDWAKNKEQYPKNKTNRAVVIIYMGFNLNFETNGVSIP